MEDKALRNFQQLQPGKRNATIADVKATANGVAGWANAGEPMMPGDRQPPSVPAVAAPARGAGRGSTRTAAANAAEQRTTAAARAASADGSGVEATPKKRARDATKATPKDVETLLRVVVP